MEEKSVKSVPPAVVLGLGATGLAVGRILGARGVSVYGVDRDAWAVGRFSKHIHRSPFGYTADGQDLCDGLIRFARDLGERPVLFATADVYIDYIGQHFDPLRDHFRIQSSLAPVVAAEYLNKRKFYRLCESHGITLPRTKYLDGTESVEQILDGLRLPVIIKPDLIHVWKKRLHGRKVILIESTKMLGKVMSDYPGMLSAAMVQEVIPGPESYIYLFKGHFEESSGRCVADFVGQKIRQYPPNFGSGSFAISTNNEDVRRLSITFLESCGFRGLCGTEFKYDSRDNEYKMIEVNIRPQLWEDLTRVAKRDVLWFTYCDLAGLTYPQQKPQVKGASWAYFVRDIASGLHFIRRRELGLWEWLRSYKNLSTDAVLDSKDWFGSLAVPVSTVRQVMGYLSG